MQKPQIKEIYDPYEINKNVKRNNVVVVMPIFNQYEATKKNILLIKQQTLVPDILIVDNGSTDNTFEKLKKEFYDVILIKAKDNYGGAGGFYLGQKYAYEKGYEYIILNDNDAYPVDNDLIENLIKECDENTVVQAFNVDEDDLRNYILWFFHWCSFHRKTIQKIGFIKYFLFLYGDEVEYSLRLKKFHILIKKIYKKYSHPMKYHYPPNRVYFAIRNEIYNQVKYPKLRSKSIISMLVVPLTFYKLYEPTKYKIAKQAIKDLLNEKWDNSFIKNKFELDVEYKQVSKEQFIKKLNNQKITYTEKPKIKKLLETYSKKQKYSKISFLKSKILLTHTPTINIFWFDKVYYIVDYNEKENTVTYFELKNNMITKLKFLLLLFFHYLYLKIIMTHLKKKIMKF